MAPMTDGDKASVLVGAWFFAFNAIVMAALCTLTVIEVDQKCASDNGECSPEQQILTGVFAVYAVASTAFAIVCLVLRRNFMKEAGTLIEQALIGLADPPALLAALDGEADERRAAALRLVSQLSADDDDLKREYVNAGCATSLVKLSDSSDPVLRMYAAEALVGFVLVDFCREAFINEGGLSSTLRLARPGGELQLQHVRQSADNAVIVLAWLLQLEKARALFFADVSPIIELARSIEYGLFNEESLRTLADIFGDLLQDWAVRSRRELQAPVTAVLGALMVGFDADRTVLVLDTAVLMFHTSRGDVKEQLADAPDDVLRVYAKALITIAAPIPLYASTKRVRFLLAVVKASGTMPLHALSFGSKLWDSLRGFVNTQDIELVGIAVELMFELAEAASHNEAAEVLAVCRRPLTELVEQTLLQPLSNVTAALARDTKELLNR